AGGDVLLVFEARLAQMHVHVHEPGREQPAFGVDHDRISGTRLLETRRFGNIRSLVPSRHLAVRHLQMAEGKGAAGPCDFGVQNPRVHRLIPLSSAFRSRTGDGCRMVTRSSPSISLRATSIFSSRE